MGNVTNGKASELCFINQMLSICEQLKKFSVNKDRA